MARDYRKAREAQESARIETAQRVRKELGLSTTDAEIRQRAKERTEAAARKVIRDNGEG